MSSAEKHPRLVEKRIRLHGSSLSTFRPVTPQHELSQMNARFPKPHSRSTNPIVWGLALFILIFAVRVKFVLNDVEDQSPSEALTSESLFSELEKELHREAPSSKHDLVAELAPTEEEKRNRLVKFVSAVIRSQLRSHPNPTDLARTIVGESIRANYDPIFVTAVIRSESMFSQRALSSAGARGLMQLLPATGRYVSGKNQIAWQGERVLYDPTMNVRLGIAYLQYLEQKFKGNREKVLIAYNWGPGNLLVAKERGARVPAQTMKYARTILSHHKQWNSVYERFTSFLDTRRAMNASRRIEL